MSAESAYRLVIGIACVTMIVVVTGMCLYFCGVINPDGAICALDNGAQWCNR